MQFAAHARLLDLPDPRRIDLRASLATTPREWLVRSHYQRAAIDVMAIVDVSPTMSFGSPRSKYTVATDFIESLCHSAYSSGDAAGLMAFDEGIVEPLWFPPRHGRGVGAAMVAALQEYAQQVGEPQGMAGTRDTRQKLSEGLDACVQRLPVRSALIFIVSDFHGSLETLPALLDRLGDAMVVPLVVWDPTETEPPPDGALLPLRGMQSTTRRAVWLRPSVQRRWREGVARRRETLTTLFKSRDIEPVFVDGRFDPARLTRYFMEHSV